MIKNITSEEYIQDMLAITDAVPIINRYVFGRETETYFCGIYNSEPTCLCCYSQDIHGDNLYIHHIETNYMYQQRGYMLLLLKYILEQYNSDDTTIHLQTTDDTGYMWNSISQKVWFSNFTWDISY